MAGSREWVSREKVDTQKKNLDKGFSKGRGGK